MLMLIPSEYQNYRSYFSFFILFCIFLILWSKHALLFYNQKETFDNIIQRVLAQSSTLAPGAHKPPWSFPPPQSIYTRPVPAEGRTLEEVEKYAYLLLSSSRL